ncbi:small basic family protein [Proteocatella sphenisci]|uniref:small basic family protein n=1 Tax=Proteocatella sphenisci TaxID=181070 RepID=UPI0004918F9A|nr:small basic family protein [Proteocatella sphenisci]
MIWAILGLSLGVIVGGYVPFTYPSSYSLYISIALLAAFDSVCGAIRASMENKYDNTLFISGFFTNAILAAMISYIGDKLGVPFYYAPIIVFGGRLFDNLAIIRRHIFK